MHWGVIVEADNTGHYRALLWKEETKAWTVDQALGIHVNVEVCSAQHAM